MDIQRLLKQNLGLKILSIIISIVLWASLKYTSPASLYNYYQTSLYVPVKYVNAPNGLVAVHTDEQVLIELKGDPAKVTSLSSSDFSAVVDMSNCKKGENTVDVTLKFPPEVTITNVQPSKINFDLEEYTSVQIPISLRTIGLPSSGYKLSSSKVYPDEVTISGPVSSIKRVKKILADVDISGINTSTKFFIPLQAFDYTGNTVKDINLMPTNVSVVCNVDRGFRIQTVSVIPNLIGDIPNGVKIKSIDVDPDVISLKIPDGVIFTSNHIKTRTIDLSKLNKNLEQEIKLELPDGVSPVDSNIVKVNIVVDKKGNK